MISKSGDERNAIQHILSAEDRRDHRRLGIV